MQPARYMSEYGAAALSNAAGLLLEEGHNEALVSFDAEVDSTLIEHVSDFTAKSVETAGEQLASKIRDSVRHNIPTLGASLRALRIAAVEKKAALALHQTDCLDWLRVLIEQGSALLRGATDGGISLQTSSTRELLWLMEPAVGLSHAILWPLAHSGLSEHNDKPLFEALTKLCIVLQCLPSVTWDAAADAFHSEHSPTLPKPGSVAEAAQALDRTLRQTLALYWEGTWPSRIQQLLSRAAEGSPSETVGAAIMLARSLPAPLPIAPEALPDAALLMLPPSTGPHTPTSLALAVGEESLHTRRERQQGGEQRQGGRGGGR